MKKRNKNMFQFCAWYWKTRFHIISIIQTNVSPPGVSAKLFYVSLSTEKGVHFAHFEKFISSVIDWRWHGPCCEKHIQTKESQGHFTVHRLSHLVVTFQSLWCTQCVLLVDYMYTTNMGWITKSMFQSDQWIIISDNVT